MSNSRRFIGNWGIKPFRIPCLVIAQGSTIRRLSTSAGSLSDTSTLQVFSAQEKAAVHTVLASDRFADASPAHIWSTTSSRGPPPRLPQPAGSGGGLLADLLGQATGLLVRVSQGRLVQRDQAGQCRLDVRTVSPTQLADGQPEATPRRAVAPRSRASLPKGALDERRTEVRFQGLGSCHLCSGIGWAPAAPGGGCPPGHFGMKTGQGSPR